MYNLPKKLNTFVKGLSTDIDAINAAVELDANNGLTEENIKRQIYERASFNLLRKKVVLAMTG